MRSSWQLQEAKNSLSKVVDKALSEGHQIITRHGEPVVVVIAAEEFRKMRGPKTKLSAFLARSPLREVSLDLRRRKDFPRKTAL